MTTFVAQVKAPRLVRQTRLKAYLINESRKPCPNAYRAFFLYRHLMHVSKIEAGLNPFQTIK